MKLFMNKNEKYEEPEVHMFFHKQTKEVEQVEKFVRSLSITIPAKYEDEIYKLYPTDIYYIETIDRRTYLYTASRVYESSENLLSYCCYKKLYSRYKRSICPIICNLVHDICISGRNPSHSILFCVYYSQNF